MPSFGVAGGYARSLVRTRAKRMAVVLLVLWGLIAIALHVYPGTSWWMSIPMLGLALWIDRRDTLALFVPWIKGARGEEAVARLLETLEPEGFRIVHGTDTGRGDLDHVVIGPTGVWALETKAWTGRVYAGKGGVFMRNGTDERRTLKQAQAEVFEVKDRIANAGLTPWVNALVVLTATQLGQGTLRFGNVTVLEAKDLLSTIRSGPVRLSPENVKIAARAVMLGAGVRSYRVTSWDPPPDPDLGG